MVDYREILRLHDLGRSQRGIALEVQSSRDTVAATITAAKAAGVSWPLDDVPWEVRYGFPLHCAGLRVDPSRAGTYGRNTYPALE